MLDTIQATPLSDVFCEEDGALDWESCPVDVDELLRRLREGSRHTDEYHNWIRMPYRRGE